MEFLSNLSWSAVDPALKATIGTAVLSLLGVFLKWIFTPKSRVKWGVPHQFAFRVKNEHGKEIPVKTREVWAFQEDLIAVALAAKKGGHLKLTGPHSQEPVALMAEIKRISTKA